MRNIDKILVANRGEIARRVFRTCHRLGISTVAVFSDADADLAHVSEADQAVRIGEAPSAASYLDIDAILEAARVSGADAIHPGYGFLSENVAFARAVQAAGLVWIGPPPDAIASMGDKAAARRVAVDAGVPVVPGYDGDDQGDACLAQEAERIGTPLLVKAVAGGGGRGMRRVDDLADLTEAIASARREAAAAFGNDRILLERYVEHPRHIEIQIMGDAHGEVIHLGERDCSVQRRHQKVIEEAPSPAVGEALREAMGHDAVRLAKRVGYEGAGTVEFVVDPDGNYYFLETNTRLQVEHPVTEEITGLDLVELQIRVAEGRPLGISQSEVQLRGHAIEVRLYAEDPVRDYMPSAGHLVRVDLPAEEGIRIDVGYRSGDDVGVHYDAMLAKIIAWGPDRTIANRRLKRALCRAWVPGIATNLPLLRDIARHPAWQEGKADTGFLAQDGVVQAPPANLEEGARIAATVAWFQRRRRAELSAVAAGWTVHGVREEQDTWAYLDQEVDVFTREGDGGVWVRVGDEAATHIRVLEASGDVYRLRTGDRVRSVRVVTDGPDGAPIEDGTTVYIHTGDAEAMVRLVPRFAPPAGAASEPGSLVAPTPAVVRKIHVARGEMVEQGTLLVTLEAMKMEHALRSPVAGEVASVLVDEGDSVAQGALLVRITESES